MFGPDLHVAVACDHNDPFTVGSVSIPASGLSCFE